MYMYVISSQKHKNLVMVKQKRSQYKIKLTMKPLIKDLIKVNFECH